MVEAAGNNLPSGYDEDFVNPVEEDFQCLICHLTLKEPVLTRCGHRFCKDCLQEHFRRSTLFNRQGNHSQPSNCPADRVDLDQDRDVFPDKATERKILSLAIKCPSEGCDWTGELRGKQDHMASCPCKIVSCTNENCQVQVRKKNLKRHVTTICQWRIIECIHCREPHPKCHMKDHIGQCVKFPVTCPNNCGGTIPREKIADHTTKDCPLTLISCPYVQMGCKRKVQRQEVESHLQSDMKSHLDLACVKLKDTEEKLDTRVFIWKVKHFSEVLRQVKAGEKKAIASAPFYTDRTESYGYKLRVQIYPNGDGSGKNTHVSVFISVMKGEYDAILPWPFKKKVKFSLIDQQEDSVKRENIARQFIPGNFSESFARPTREENKGYGCHEFISHEELHSRRYLVDDTLFLQVEVGPSSS